MLELSLLPEETLKSRSHRVPQLTALRISGGRTRELARVVDRPLQPLDGRREAPGRQRMAIRSPDGAARSDPKVALEALVGRFTQIDSQARTEHLGILRALPQNCLSRVNPLALPTRRLRRH